MAIFPVRVNHGSSAPAHFRMNMKDNALAVNKKLHKHLKMKGCGEHMHNTWALMMKVGDGLDGPLWEAVGDAWTMGSILPPGQVVTVKELFLMSVALQVSLIVRLESKESAKPVDVLASITGIDLKTKILSLFELDPNMFSDLELFIEGK